jgi:hypothetical protein
MDKIKVSDLIAEALEALNIQHVFGMIGAGNIHLFESISRRGYTEIVCIHHEQAATMAMRTRVPIPGAPTAYAWAWCSIAPARREGLPWRVQLAMMAMRTPAAMCSRRRSAGSVSSCDRRAAAAVCSSAAAPAWAAAPDQTDPLAF